MKILIVEDDSLVLNSLEFYLKKENHDVIISVDGIDALNKLEEQKPDLIITDIMMPYVSGLELIQQIKEKFDDQIPIIVISSLGNEDTVLEAFSLGANDFLTKPIKIDELNTRLNRFNPHIID